MKKTLFILLIITEIITFEKYPYKVILEKSMKNDLINPSIFYPQKNSLTNWNISFWIRINSLDLSDLNIVYILQFQIDDFIHNLKINPQTNEFIFDNTIIGTFLMDNNLEDFKDLKAYSKNWLFFSLNSEFKKLKIFFQDNIFEFLTNELYFIKVNINLAVRPIEEKIIFCHFHFFEMNIPEEDINIIKFYPKKIKAIYKFSDLHSNSNLIVNSFNFSKFRNLKITNNNKIPFKKNYNSFIDVKIDFPFFDRSLVFKNLIICINGNIIFRNFIKDNKNFENIFWTINWYTRKSEDNLNNLNIQTRISYSEISLISHNVLFETIQSENNLNPDFTLSKKKNLNIGNSKRDDYNLKIVTILQIKDIPLPNSQKLKEFHTKIPKLNFSEILNYSFDLSFYDLHFFKLNFTKPNPLLMYLILNEILIYRGDQIIKENNNIFLTKEKKILIKCEKNHNLIRSFPDTNEKVILDICLENKKKCPSISGCLFCISKICIYCESGYKLFNGICSKCKTNEIFYNDNCELSEDINIMNLEQVLINSDFRDKVFALKIYLETLKDFSDFDSSTNVFENTIYYLNYDTNLESEKSENILNLLDLDNFKIKRFSYKVFSKPSEIKNFTTPINCEENKKYFIYDINENFKGSCQNNCLSKIINNNYCINPIYSCKEENELTNRCNICEIKYKKINYNINKNYCTPQYIQDDIIINENEIINKNNIICDDFNCELCNLNGKRCFFCKENFISNDSYWCVSKIQNCDDLYNGSNCILCKNDFKLFFDLNRCVKNSSSIFNCIDFDYTDEEYCNTCEDNFFLFKNNGPPFDCIHFDYFIDKCINYSIGPNYICYECEDNFFLFKKILKNFKLLNFCINKIYLVNNCVDYNAKNYLCTECKKDYYLINTIENKKLCIPENSLIKNCNLYNQNFQCEKYNEICTLKKKENCLKCKLGNILVNNKCVDMCSLEALNCKICENFCPIYLCIKLIPFCLECDKNNFSLCFKCENNFILKNGNCVEETIIDILNFNKCYEGCGRCHGIFCFDCKFGYHFDEKKKICILKQKIIKKYETDYCKKDKIFCTDEYKLQFQSCLKCHVKCNCFITYIKNLPILKCDDNRVIFKNKTEKILNISDKIIINLESKTKLNFTFKKNIEKTFIQIPKYLIKQTKNCTFNYQNFFEIKNKNFKKKNLNKTTLKIFKYNSNFIPLLSSILSNGILAYLLLICQIQEIFSYLFLVNFKGGNIYNYLNNSDLNFFEFGDVINQKLIYEKKFIFQREKYFSLNFIDFQDLSMFVVFLFQEIFFFFLLL